MQNGIAYLTINRPKQLNALNRKTLEEIGFLADKLKNDETIKVLIIRGAGGRAFVAGADISEMQNMNEEEGREISTIAQEVFSKLKELPQIVIGAINGYTLGGGVVMNLLWPVIFVLLALVLNLVSQKLILVSFPDSQVPNDYQG